MDNWISVEDRLPDFENGYVLVACEGGNVDMTFYSKNVDFLASAQNAGAYNRKRCGKLSKYFELSHLYGYKITHWQPRPKHPEDK